VHRVGDGYVDRRSHVCADGLGHVPAIFATRLESANESPAQERSCGPPSFRSSMAVHEESLR